MGYIHVLYIISMVRVYGVIIEYTVMVLRVYMTFRSQTGQLNHPPDTF